MAPLLKSSKDPTKAMSLETLMSCSKDPHLGLSMDLMTAPLLGGLKDSMTEMSSGTSKGLLMAPQMAHLLGSAVNIEKNNDQAAWFD